MRIKMRTSDEKIRLIREGGGGQDGTSESLAAGVAGGGGMPYDRASLPIDRDRQNIPMLSTLPHTLLDHDDKCVIKVDVRTNSISTFVIVSTDTVESSEYKIINDSCCHVLQYKQKGVLGNKWNQLEPQAQVSYL